MAKMLIIDDDDKFRNMLQNMLDRSGHKTIVAEDGEKGVEAYKNSTFDIVITDIIMPNKEGVQTISDLKKINPNVLIIAVSGGGFGSADSYLKTVKELFQIKYTFSKPFDMKELLNAIDDLCLHIS